MLTIFGVGIQVDTGEGVPHVTIEYSANVADHHDVDALVVAVHDAALAHGLASVTALRTRAAERQHYRVGDGSESFAFVAIHVRLGPGRTDDEKTTFMEQVLNAAQSRVGDSKLAIAWSIEVNEIDPTMRINRNGVRAVMEAE